MLVLEASCYRLNLDAHKVIRYDKDGIQYGIKDFPVDSFAIHYKNVISAIPTARFHNNVVVIRFNETTSDLIDTLVNERQVAGILFLLPSNFDDIIEQELLNMKDLEKYIFSHSFECFMYFAEENPELTYIYQEITVSVYFIYIFYKNS